MACIIEYEGNHVCITKSCPTRYVVWPKESDLSIQYNTDYVGSIVFHHLTHIWEFRSWDWGKITDAMIAEVESFIPTLMTPEVVTDLKARHKGIK